jgi:mRNA degradation ribonuclease J1/J2
MRFHQLHASGHLNKTGLKSVIKRISAEKIFPVHTENPSAFKEFCKNTEITEREKEYAI